MTSAVRLGAILAAAGAIVFAVVGGWQPAAMFLVGSLISITGVWEWRRLMTAVAVQMDSAEPIQPHEPVAMETAPGGPDAGEPVVERDLTDGDVDEGALDAEAHVIQKPKMGFVLAVFFLRLGLTVVVLYVTLKYLRGSALALAAGLMVGIIALTVQAVRLLRTWSA